MTAPDNEPRAKHRPPKRHKRHAGRTSSGSRCARWASRTAGVELPEQRVRLFGSRLLGLGRLGVEVPHSSYALAAIGRRIGRPHLKPGDVLVFSGYGHVGLYVGRGRMVHAPHSGTRVQVVTLGGSNYGSRLVAARRVTRT